MIHSREADTDFFIELSGLMNDLKERVCGRPTVFGREDGVSGP